MSVTVVLGPGRVAQFDREALAAARDGLGVTIVDVGTGDGRFAYHLATSRPEAMVVGIDPLAENMGETARRAARKPARGGRPNLLLVRAAVEALPEELVGIADEVYVQLPWGRLLEGIVRGDEAVLAGIAALCAPRARLTVTLNGEIWEGAAPARYADLPVPDPAYVADVVAPGFAAAGIHIGPARYLDAAAAKALPTTWARRLGHGRAHPRFVRFEGESSA